MLRLDPVVQYRVELLRQLLRQAYGVGSVGLPGLHLQTLEFSIHGYCIYRQFGWERIREAAFSTRPPPFWQRLLQRAPLLELRVCVNQDGCSITIGAAWPGTRRSRANCIWRLTPELQQQISQIDYDCRQGSGAFARRGSAA
ncbi:hypothetical protein [Massilia sp. YIM B04103]|uniref:hypothetical protein n=1 Tax=Massilia sp. YIM B04103 TaxID=2963106 RepID=UPI00210D1AE6|nr:hypothetical protein [Massilia sp. YIM B04103]